MAVNIQKLIEKKNESATKNNSLDFWQVPSGENLIFVGPPYPGDELPFLEVKVHYGVGKENKMVVCLDQEQNPILQDERIQKYLKKKKIKLSDDCPVCKAVLESGGKEAQPRYFWNVVPLKFRKPGKKWRDSDDVDELRLYACGYTVWNGILDVFINNGDISDPKKAILIMIGRKGKGLGTKYTIAADSNSIRQGGVQLSKPVRALLRKHITEGGIGDLYKIVANMVKSKGELEAMVEGIEFEDEVDDETDTEEKPLCFGTDFDADDDSCSDCSFADECEEKCGPTDESDEDEDEEVQESDDEEVQESDDEEVQESDDEEEEDQEDEEQVEDDDEEELEGCFASDCTVGQWYEDEDDNLLCCKKVFKTKVRFENEQGKTVNLPKETTVWVSDKKPAPPPKPDMSTAKKKTKTKKTAKPKVEIVKDDDPDLALLNQKLAERKKARKKKAS